VTASKDRLGDELRMAAEAIRKLKNDIELAGGQRLRDIPTLIEREDRFFDVEAAGVAAVSRSVAEMRN